MSVKRYQPVAQCVEPSYQAQMVEPKVMEFSEGEYVMHSDYARLKAEVERLRKAGDAMASCIQFNEEMEQDYEGPTIVRQCVKDWHAAKEGRPNE